MRWLKLSILLLLLTVVSIGSSWLILDARIEVLEERIKANRAAELHLNQAQDIVAITNALSDRIRRVEER